MDVKTFYDEYVACQTVVGINDRHRSILKWLQQSGLRPDHRVLEIGCGVGTLTRLVAEAVSPNGFVTAMDLSPKSIEAARERLAAFRNVRLMAADVLEAELEERFDVIVLPDVIEHIPLHHHPALFERVASWARADGFVLLHYPNPHYLEWCREHRPDLLQIIDQPIHADLLLSNTYRSGLHLDFLARYAIWTREGDYVVAVLRPSAGARVFTELAGRRPSPLARVRGLARRLTS
jgi:trans-aconitate 2-methyltransferase